MKDQLEDRVTALAHSFPLRYMSSDFPSLVEGAEGNERDIRIQAAQFFETRLLQLVPTASRANQNVLLLDGTPYEIQHNDGFPKRTQVFVVQAMQPGRQRTKRISRSIRSFGYVNKIEVIAPVQISAEARQVVEELKIIYKAAYTALEDAFVSKYLAWRYTLFDTLYTLTNIHLKIAGAPDLVGRFWFSVTDLSSTKFRYQFDKTALETAIEWFKQRNDDTIGAYFGLSLLLVQDANDAIFGEEKFETNPIELDDRTKVVKFSNLPHFAYGMQGFFVAESQLYDSESMACIDIVTTDSLSLQINCPTDSADQIKQGIAPAVRDIEDLFRAHQKSYERDLRSMNQALDRLKNTRGWVREIGTDFAAKFAANVARGY